MAQTFQDELRSAVARIARCPANFSGEMLPIGLLKPEAASYLRLLRTGWN